MVGVTHHMFRGYRWIAAALRMGDVYPELSRISLPCRHRKRTWIIFIYAMRRRSSSF